MNVSVYEMSECVFLLMCCMQCVFLWMCGMYVSLAYLQNRESVNFGWSFVAYSSQ